MKIKKSLLKTFVWIFIAVCFLVTCCLFLFLTVLSRSTGIIYTEQLINTAAKFTFLNTIILSIILTVSFIIYSDIKVKKATKWISDTLAILASGDFSIHMDVDRNDDELFPISENINKLAKELSGIETLRLDFISNVSHELKTPLSVIQEYASLLKEPGLSEKEISEYTSIISNETQRLSKLVTDILQLNKLENQQIYPDRREVNLKDSISEAILTYENSIDEKQLAIDVSIGDELYVESDPELLGIVWRNIFSNSIKFTPPGGRISISGWKEEKRIIISFSDTGKGMTKEEKKHIFDKFYRADASRKTEGNGLGLALVKRITDILGLEVEVESEPEKGTRMSIVFPFSKD